MAVKTLYKISQDEITRDRIMQEQKRIQDAESDRLYCLRKGREEGITQGKIKIARNLLKMGLSIKQIAQGTDLSIEEIESLKN